jgi:uncharacterized protein (UPF0276 family)
VNAGDGLPELGVGIVYSSALEPLLEAHPDVVDVVEVEPQTTWLEAPERPGTVVVRRDVDEHLARLPFAKLVHSIGTPVGGSIAAPDEHVSILRDTVAHLRAPWASEHLAFNTTRDFFTGFFLPPRQTAAGLDVYASAIRRLAARIEVPLAVETGVNYLRPRADEIPDGEFVARLVDRADCGILLDLHNIYANACNGRQSVAQFLAEIPLDRVWEIHIAGGFEFEGYWLDAHSGAVPDRLLAMAREIVPQLPNLKAIVFEVFASFLPRFGLPAVRTELDRLRELWARRQPGKPAAPRTGARALAGDDAASDVVAWEASLGALVVGQPATSPLARELAQDPGVALMRTLIHEFRASMVVGVYRLSCRLMMLALTPDVFRAMLEDFWTHEPPRAFAASEAEAFMAYLRRRELRLPQLAKVLEFEKAAMDTLLDGKSRVVHFAADPFPLLRALAEGRLPDIIPQEGDYEIELEPEAATRASGIDIEELGAASRYH